MKKNILLLCFLFPLVALAQDGENILSNGGFVSGIDGWWFNVVRDDQILHEDSRLSWETKDTYGKSKGALRVTMPNPENPPLRGHNTGAVCASDIKVDWTTKRVKVRFAAKSIGDSAVLFVSPLWGGPKALGVVLTPEWKVYEMDFIPARPEVKTKAEVIFSLVKNDRGDNRLAEGAFLLGQVEILLSHADN